MPGRAFLPFKNKSDMIKVLKEVGFTDNDIEEGSRVITVDSSKYFLRIDSICIVRFSKNDNEYSRLWIHNKIPSVENLKKFLKLRGEYSLIGRKIVKETQATAEKVFAYKGQVITASSKQEAIQKIISSPKISIKEKIYNAKSFNERELLKKVLDATKHPDEKIEIKGKGEYSSVYIIVRKGNIVNIDNVVGDLDWAGIRKNETEAKKLFNYWKQLAKKECDGKIRFRTLVNEITKENSVWHD